MARSSRPSIIGTCEVCAEPETREWPLVAVLTEVRNHHAWMHAGACHERYREEVARRKQAETKMKVAG